MNEIPFMKIGADVLIGNGVRFCGYANLYGCKIGDFCNIGPFVEIQKGVCLGRFVKVQSHSFICEGVQIEDEVFIGHGVMFINDRFPRATTLEGKLKGDSDWVCEKTLVKQRASIGSNATIMCGVTIGADAIVGAASMVISNIPARAIAVGNPAKIVRYLD